jgi:LuxR family transcriptional regulator, quorum-sensing system regulator BjaR1
MKDMRSSSARALADRSIADLVFEFAHIAQSAPTLREVEEDLSRRLNRFGLRYFILYQAADRRRTPSAALLSGRSCQPWREHYTHHAFAANDDLMLSGLQSARCLTWGQYRQREDLSVGQARIFNEAEAFGLKDGFYLPIHQLDGSVFAVSMMGDHPVDPDPKTLSGLHMLGLYYLIAARRFCANDGPILTLPANSQKPRLTQRQRECLQWVRAGKTDWEISQIIGISEHTVIEHLEEARKRLGVRTRTQAVIEGIALGLIAL